MLIMDELTLRLVVAITISTLIAYKGYKKKSLSTSGAISGWLTGFITCYYGGYRCTAVLLTFFVTSSYFTKVGWKRKSKLEEEFKKGWDFQFNSMISNVAHQQGVKEIGFKY
jgi:uncharacterized membrane protein